MHLTVDREVWEMAKVLREVLGPPNNSMTKWVEAIIGQYVNYHMRDPTLMTKIQRALQWRKQRLRIQQVRQEPVDVEAFWKNALTDERWNK